jgi:glycerophosphoryl diester phosphodiesterase
MSPVRPIHPALAGRPLLIAHRGGSALAPENTMFAFHAAVNRWSADMIELDVRASADGRCVVIHDPTVDRTTNGTGDVAAFSLAQLRELDAGFHFTRDGGRTYPLRGQGITIPTIEELLEQLGDARITVEVKTAAAQRPLFDAIRRFGAEDRVIAAGERRAFRTLFGEWTGCVSACREDALPYYVLHRLGVGFLGRVPADVVQIPERFGGQQAVSPKLIRELHAKGVQVHVWTVNEVADMHRLLDWGVDGLVTDRPDLLATVLNERVGRPLPPGAHSPA